MAHGPSRSAACGILPAQGPNPCPLHWQADSQPLHHQGSPQASSIDHLSLTLQGLFINFFKHSNLHRASLSSHIWFLLPEIFFLTLLTWAIFIHPSDLSLNVTFSKRSFLRSQIKSDFTFSQHSYFSFITFITIVFI